MGSADDFYHKGRQLDQAGGYDYAIEMFIRGLGIEPDNVDAHRALRELSLRRRAAGSGPLGLFELLKVQGEVRKATDEKTRMLAAEKILAYDPSNLAAMLDLLRHAHAAGFAATAAWVQSLIDARTK